MFMADISIIVRRMRTQAERSIGEAGLGFPEQLVLMFLIGHDPSKQEAIATQLGVDKGAVAKTIAKLEEKGLVTRKVNPASKREKIVETTAAAAGLISAMNDMRRATEAALFAGFTDEEIQQTCAFLARIARNVSESEKELPL